MKNIALIFGGKSVEHEVSILTALQIFPTLSKRKYKVFPIYISKSGIWHYIKKMEIKTFKNQNQINNEVSFKIGTPILLKKSLGTYKKMCKIDVCLLAVHGKNVEDGCLQGLLENCNVAYTGCDVISSAICMDKQKTKDICVANSIPCVNYIYFYRNDYEKNSKQLLNKIKEEINFPVIVKPCSLGSSIGISKCNNKTECRKAIEMALNYDDKIVIEKCVKNLLEVNCAIMGNRNGFEMSYLEQPTTQQDILGFNEKYISQEKNKRIINGIIEPWIKYGVEELSKTIFKVFDCSGIIRIDFLIDNKAKNIYANEINTIPGSMANYLFRDFYDFCELTDKLIEIAEQNYKKKQITISTFDSSILDNFCSRSIKK